jgi:hypothetical protein
LLLRHVRNGCDNGFEQDLQSPLLTEALDPFDPGDHRSFVHVFECVECAARHAQALGHVDLSNLFLNPQAF